jgi:(p)ppGpp synthase/HD superfamily hydrolase
VSEEEVLRVERLVFMASAFATTAHEGQTEFGGTPYIRHPHRVAAIVSSELIDREFATWGTAVVIALLHDVVEDTPVTLAEIETEFGPEVAAGVDILSRRDGELYYDYIERVRE